MVVTTVVLKGACLFVALGAAAVDRVVPFGGTRYYGNVVEHYNLTSVNLHTSMHFFLPWLVNGVVPYFLRDFDFWG